MFEVINKIDPPKALYTYAPTPVFRTAYERDKYNDEQKRRWVEGFNGLTGKHYFYLQECKIKDGTNGQLIRPIWRDVDQWLFEALDKAEHDQYDFGVLKRREFGLTSIGAGCIPNYMMRVFPGSTCIMTSCDKPRIFRMFEDKTITVWDNLRKDIKPVKERKNQTKENVYLKTKLKVVDENGDTQIRESDIFCSETVETPTAFSSVRAKYGFYDEFPLHENREKLLASSRACFMKSTERTGLLMWGGTVEQGITAETLRALRYIVADAKVSKTYIFFVEAWMGLDKFMVNGHSNKEKGVEWVMRERERLSKMQDKTEYYGFIKNYPLTLDEALESTATGTLPPEVTEIINEQRKIIIKDPPPVFKCSLYRAPSTDRVFHKIDNHGKFTVLEKPIEGEEYIAGTDPIPFNSQSIDDGSEYCIAIKRRSIDTYVAYYAERNLDADTVVDNCIDLQDWYNNAKTMMERNHGSVAVEKYKDRGRMDLLANKPQALGINFVDNKKSVKGYYKNDKTSARANACLIKHLKEHGTNLWFKRQIDELERFLLENTDLVDAMLACELYDANLSAREKKKSKAPVQRVIPKLERDSSGKTVIVWHTIRVD